MQSDYVVRLTGQDNLSSTVRQVKKELQDVGSAASSMEKIDAKFNKIINSSAPLKRQLRDLQGLMAKMNMDGLSNTEQFTRIAQEAGKIKDAINDAGTAVSKFSSDTMGLQAGIQAMQGLVAAANIATGAMALLGTENEDIARSIQKVQGALALLNGVQTIANTLNKDSVLMHKLKQIQLAANTAATNRATTAEIANTVATNANTVATKAWNIAKAISKAMFGDFTGLLLVGVGALGAYALATDKSTKKTEENTNAVRQQSAAYSAYQNTIKDLTGKFVDLKTQWSNLATATQRNKFIKDNQQAFAALGVEVKNVDDAERVFGNNTQAIVQAMIQRAKYAKMYQEAMELVSQIIDEQSKHNNAVAAGEDEFVHYAKANELQGELNKKVKEMQALAPKMPKTVSSRTTKSSGSNTKSTSNEIKPVAGSIKDLDNQISELQKKLEYGLIPSDKIKDTLKLITQLKAERAGKIMIMQGFTVDNDSSLTTYNDKLKEIEKTDDELVAANQRLFDSMIQLDGFWNNDNIDKSIQQQKNQITKLEESAIAWQGYADIINGVGEATRILGDSQEAQVAQFATNTAAILANAVSTIAAMNAEALAKGASSAFSLPFPYNLAAWATVAATIGSIFASLPKFAEGGIVGGGSLYGDKMLARVNSSEMILNGKQQKHLFDAIDSGKIGGGTVSTVTWRLKGSDLYGSMKNYSKGVSKTGHITGIK